VKSFATSQLARGFLFAMVLSAPAFAQYGGGGSAAQVTALEKPLESVLVRQPQEQASFT
jgi:hypothetical protein